MMRIDVVNRMYDVYSVQADMAMKNVNKPQGRDKVDLSNEAKEFTTVKKLVANTEEVREDKVRELKEKMDQGTYDVTAEQVASKILSKINLKG